MRACALLLLCVCVDGGGEMGGDVCVGSNVKDVECSTVVCLFMSIVDFIVEHNIPDLFSSNCTGCPQNRELNIKQFVSAIKSLLVLPLSAHGAHIRCKRLINTLLHYISNSKENNM